MPSLPLKAITKECGKPGKRHARNHVQACVALPPTREATQSTQGQTRGIKKLIPTIKGRLTRNSRKSKTKRAEGKGQREVSEEMELVGGRPGETRWWACHTQASMSCCEPLKLDRAAQDSNQVVAGANTVVSKSNHTMADIPMDMLIQTITLLSQTNGLLNHTTSRTTQIIA